MLTDTLIKLFTRDLEALKTELSSYKTEKVLWMVDKNISNSAGNLSLHLIGNLNHFIGNKLGDTGYIRNRALEFSDKNVPLSVLLTNIDKTKIMISNTLSCLNNNDLQAAYRRDPNHTYMTTEYFLAHLVSHLAYHLGQINYHRRLLDS